MSGSGKLLRTCFALTVLFLGMPAMGQTTVTPERSGIQIDGEYGPWLPPNIAVQEYAHKGDLLTNVMHIFMALLFVGWGIFFLFCLVRFRARPGHKANPSPIKGKISKGVEIGVAIFEAALLIGISFPVWASVKEDLPLDKNPVHVRVIAEQFQWNFHYPGPDGKFGKTAPQFVDTATNPVGIDRGDPDGEDDFSIGEFHIPVNRPVIAQIGTKDVIHSFFVPVLRVKQDAIPGMRIPMWFEAGQTGNYEVACAQLCGNNHYSMRAVMVVESQEAFDEWVAEKSKPAEIFNEDDL